MKTAFVIIATGQSYIEYAIRLVESIREFCWFDPNVVIFTDNPQPLQTSGRVFVTEKLGYPKQTLMRYHTILSKEHILNQYDQLFYIDADMEFVKRVELDDIASDGLTATLHPGFFEENTCGTPECRPESTAYCENNALYFCGGFQGGNAKAYLNAAKTMAANISLDLEHGITAVWHDESHWNRYLTDNPPAKILTPSFCYPEDYDNGYVWLKDECPAVLVALDKRKRQNHPRFNNAR